MLNLCEDLMYVEAAIDVNALTKKKKKDYFYASCIVIAAWLSLLRHQELPLQSCQIDSPALTEADGRAKLSLSN